MTKDYHFQRVTKVKVTAMVYQVVMGEDSYLRVGEFKSHCRIPDGCFFTFIFCQMVCRFEMTNNKSKKAEDGHILKKQWPQRPQRIFFQFYETQIQPQIF